ncbi:MAG: hypothetical protein C5B58_06595 [Acidobacteria bacterium]|nr:MAG: hypothetical protein C5B58_06595 [Acidobacteriota bacterium]
MHPKIKFVEHFVDVAETGSLTRSSMQLEVPRSMLSREIQGLEAELGYQLFHRTGRGLKMTEFGRQLFPRAQRLVMEARRFSDEASTLRGRLSGSVSIGLPGSVTALIAGPLMSVCRENYPDVFIRFIDGVSGGIEELLATGRIDIGLFYTSRVDTRRGDMPLTVSDLYLIGPANDSIAAKGSVSLAEVVKCPLLLPSRRGGIRSIVEEGAIKIGMRPNVVCEIDSLLTLVEVISTGFGYTVCSLEAVSRDIRTGRVQAAIIRDPQMTRTLVMVLAAKNVLTAAARAVADLIPDALVRLIDEGSHRPLIPAGHADSNSGSAKRLRTG